MTTRLNPFDALLEKVPRLGVIVEAATVVSATAAFLTVTQGGVTLPDVPYIGGPPSAGHHVWLLRQGSTVLALSKVAISGTVGPPGPEGDPGPAGPQGIPGPVGPEGNSSTWWIYNFSTGTTPDPLDGQVRYNNANPALATRLYISYTTADGAFPYLPLQQFVAGDQVRLEDEDEASRWQLFEVTAPDIFGPTYTEVPVTRVSGGSLPLNGQRTHVLIIRRGPEGDPGEVSYAHVQGVAAATWTINHPLPFQPNVTVVDSAGEQVEGTVDYVDADTITVAFSGAFSGTAYLS